jgi:hypothetical protein
MTDLMEPQAPEQEVQELQPGYRVDPATGAWVTLPWPSDAETKDRLIANSIGPLVIRWAENQLTDEEFELYGPGLIHHLHATSWRFTPGQKRFLILWYAYDPDTGRYLYRRGVKRGAKGTGKDPFAAAHGNCELAGPTHLVWDDEKGWTGIQHRVPLVQIAANSEKQAKEVLNTANAMWSREALAWHGIETQKTQTNLQGRGRFEVLTSSEASAEGDPATFIILNESHHMIESNQGHRLTEVARRNVGKSPEDLQGRLVEYTNAHSTSDDSTAQRSYETWQDKVSGRNKGKQDFLYDSIEADPNLKLSEPEQLKLALKQAYSDAPWSDLERIEAEIYDSDLSEAQAIRFYLNGFGTREDAWVDPRNWDGLSRADIVVADGDRIAMFLDCSKSSDTTGLVGVRISDGHAFVLGYWRPKKTPRGDHELVPRHEVDAAVRDAFQRYRVMWFGVDPSPAKDDDTEHLYWKPTIDSWHQDFHQKLSRRGLWATGTPGAKFGHSVLFDMRLSQHGAHERMALFTEMAEQVAIWVDEEHSITHDGDPALRLHVHNARNKGNKWGTSLGKESPTSKKHVDLAICLVGAHLGRRLLKNNTKIRTDTRGGGRSTQGRECVVL